MSTKKSELPSHDDHGHEPDGCLCDIEYEAGTEINDVDLPQAVGGVALPLSAAFDESVDGCDLDFTTASTDDADLPTSAGGVE